MSKKRSIQGRLTSQSGDRVIFERLAAPRPAPKVAVKSKWLKMTFQAAGNSVRTVSKVLISVNKKSSQIHFSHNEANTQEIERGKNGSNKFCIHEDPAKEKMVFSKESSRAVFEMDNVDLIELKKSRVQCPSCLH